MWEKINLCMHDLFLCSLWKLSMRYINNSTGIQAQTKATWCQDFACKYIDWIYVRYKRYNLGYKVKNKPCFLHYGMNIKISTQSKIKHLHWVAFVRWTKSLFKSNLVIFLFCQIDRVLIFMTDHSSCRPHTLSTTSMKWLVLYLFICPIPLLFSTFASPPAQLWIKWKWNETCFTANKAKNTHAELRIVQKPHWLYFDKKFNLDECSHLHT